MMRHTRSIETSAPIIHGIQHVIRSTKRCTQSANGVSRADTIGACMPSSECSGLCSRAGSLLFMTSAGCWLCSLESTSSDLSKLFSRSSRSRKCLLLARFKRLTTGGSARGRFVSTNHTTRQIGGATAGTWTGAAWATTAAGFRTRRRNLIPPVDIIPSSGFANPGRSPPAALIA